MQSLKTNVEDITRLREDMNFMFEWQEQYLTSELSSLQCRRFSLTPTPWDAFLSLSKPLPSLNPSLARQNTPALQARGQTECIMGNWKIENRVKYLTSKVS